MFIAKYALIVAVVSFSLCSFVSANCGWQTWNNLPQNVDLKFNNDQAKAMNVREIPAARGNPASTVYEGDFDVTVRRFHSYKGPKGVIVPSRNVISTGIKGQYWVKLSGPAGVGVIYISSDPKQNECEIPLIEISQYNHGEWIVV